MLALQQTPTQTIQFVDGARHWTWATLVTGTLNGHATGLCGQKGDWYLRHQGTGPTTCPTCSILKAMLDHLSDALDHMGHDN